jgi:hypothetical protein
MVSEPVDIVNIFSKITRIYVPNDYLAFFLVGYSDGKFEIRDCDTLKHVFFSHVFKDKEEISDF